MPFLRLTRDSRGYEYTFLLHASHHGEEPRVLYWYRSAPGVRVGRPALDEEAIRSIEERHPEIEFDWPQIIEVGATMAPEVDRRPERPRRRPARPPDASAPVAVSEPEAVDSEEPPALAMPTDGAVVTLDHVPPQIEPVASSPPVPRSALLDELLGREIASRLRERHAEIAARLRALPAQPQSAAWQARADALNPDSWVTPDAVLRGVEQADRLFDELRRDLA